MRIRCKETGTFLCEVNIEEHYSQLKKMGIDITTPITIKFSCRKCKCIEYYDIFPTKYICKKKEYKKLTNK